MKAICSREWKRMNQNAWPKYGLRHHALSAMAQREEQVSARRKVRYAPLSRGLEEEPLKQRVPLLVARHGQPLLGVVLVDEIEKDGVGFPTRHSDSEDATKFSQSGSTYQTV